MKYHISLKGGSGEEAQAICKEIKNLLDRFDITASVGLINDTLSNLSPKLCISFASKHEKKRSVSEHVYSVDLSRYNSLEAAEEILYLIGCLPCYPIEEGLALVPYYPAFDITLPWYQDETLVKQCDNRDEKYDLDLLQSMYRYLSSLGFCFYIVRGGRPIGDITLKDDGEICIVISPEYQNKHVGRKAVSALIAFGKQRGFSAFHAEIYPFNLQSRKMFSSLGFVEGEDGIFTYPQK